MTEVLRKEFGVCSYQSDFACHEARIVAFYGRNQLSPCSNDKRNRLGLQGRTHNKLIFFHCGFTVIYLILE